MWPPERATLHGQTRWKKDHLSFHGAVFDITTGQNLEGLKLANPQEMGLPKEMIEMFKRTMEIVVKVKIDPLKMYAAEVRDGKIRVSIE